MNHKLLVLLEIIRCVYCLAAHHSAEETKAYFRSIPPVNFSLADGQETDVIYKLFEETSQTAGIIVTTKDAEEKIKRKTIPTVLLIHGWTTDDTSPWYKPLKDEYFKLGPHNIIYINWSKAGNKSFQISAANVQPIGKYMAEFLVASKVDLKRVHLVGHSLGSQLAAFIGKYIIKQTSQKIGRITGLDPAGPSFSNPLMPEEERLNSNDADFVDNIHTDVQLFGFAAPHGHVDFYPNGGTHQPGCLLREQDDNCSHARSTLYFIESLGKEIEAVEATYSDENHIVKVTPKKENPRRVIFGQHCDSNARGVYHFETNSVKPFLTSSR